jgi:hypothetical protein
MMKNLISNQHGAALVAGMLILVSLTLLGMAGLTLTSIDTQISGNYRSSVQALELANAAVAQIIYWFNNPSTFTDTTVGTYLSGTNSGEKGTNFFAKRRTTGNTNTFFTSNRSQFYDVNGDEGTLASNGSPALEYNAGVSAQKTFLDNTFNQLSDVGIITSIRIWSTSNPEEVCTAWITTETNGGGSVAIEVIFIPGPVQSIGEGLEVGGSGSFAGKSAKVHWSDALIVGEVEFTPWATDSPARRTTGTAAADQPDNKLYGSGGPERVHDPWLDIKVGDEVEVNNDGSGHPDCNGGDTDYDRNALNQYISDNTDPTKTIYDCNPNHFGADPPYKLNIFPGQNNDSDSTNDIALDKWDYNTSKVFAKRNTITKGGSTYPGYYYTQSGPSNKNKIWNLAGTEYAFSSFVDGITEGFMFVDTSDQQIPNAGGTNLQEVSFSGNTYTKGSFYIAANVKITGLGSTTNINVSSPPWDPLLADPATSTDAAKRVAVSNLPVHIYGPFYVAGTLELGGDPQIFGALITERGFSGAGTPEIWYDYDLRDGPGDVSAVTIKSWREVREQ